MSEAKSTKKEKPHFELKVDGLADGTLKVRSFEGHEGLSMPFCYQLKLFSDGKDPVNPKSVKEKQAHLIWKWMEPPRLVHGIITAFCGVAQPPPNPDGTAADPSPDEKQRGEQRGYEYTATLVPPLAQLAHPTRPRVFNAMSTPEIVKQVLGEAKQELGEWKLKETYLKRAHCAQYQESTLRFLGRILAQDGLCYFFDQDASATGQCRLVLADQNDAFRKLPPLDKKSKVTAPEGSVLRYVRPGHGEQGVGQYQQQDQQGPRTFTTQEPDCDSTEQGGSTEGTCGDDKLLVSKAYGATYQVVLPQTAEKSKRAKGKGAPPPEDGIDPELVKRLNTVRAEVAKTQQNLARGQSNCDRLAAGTRFTLQGYTDKRAKDFELVVVQVRHIASDQPSYGNAFVAFPLALGTFRPPQNIPKPRAAGVDTAKVVSATQQEGAPVDSRPDGRVRVQLGYDSRAPGKDVPAGKSSSWVRVLQPWAGAGHGALFLPRAGDEVIIAYEGGDPDRPIVIGSVYNSQHTAPLLASKAPVGKAKLSGAANLQANCTVAGIVSGGNQIAINDTSGRAQVVITAQQDLVICVVKNQDCHVAGNQTESIEGTLTIKVKGKVAITSDQEIALEAAGSSVTINKGGVQMKGKVVGVTADGGASINLSGRNVDINT